MVKYYCTGFCGHMNFQCNGGSDGGLTRIDYKKYANGDKNFIFEDKPLNETTIKHKVYGNVAILGSDCFEAAIALKELLNKCDRVDDIYKICDEIESKFDVIVMPEND